MKRTGTDMKEKKGQRTEKGNEKNKRREHDEM